MKCHCRLQQKEKGYAIDLDLVVGIVTQLAIDMQYERSQLYNELNAFAVPKPKRKTT